MTQPVQGIVARRHRCEFCQKIFECHLCTTKVTHALHWCTPFSVCDELRGRNGARSHYFRCPTCVEASGKSYVVLSDGSTVDELTGQYLTKKRYAPARIFYGLPPKSV